MKDGDAMSINIVILGGNGYIGRQLVQTWRARNADTKFWLLSRSGESRLDLPNVHGVAVDLTQSKLAAGSLPAQIDYIVDLVGGPKDNQEEMETFNRVPAQLMAQLAAANHPRAMGFIGGKLGPKNFVTLKHEIIHELQSSPTPLAVVEPTLVYGAGRQDQMTRYIPILRVLGTVFPKLKPVKVEDVVQSLLDKLLVSE